MDKCWRYVFIIVALLLLITINVSNCLECYNCHERMQCNEGRCYGHACVKTFLSVIDFVSKGCVNKTVAASHKIGCGHMKEFLGFPTTVCYCDTDFCNFGVSIHYSNTFLTAFVCFVSLLHFHFVQ